MLFSIFVEDIHRSFFYSMRVLSLIVTSHLYGQNLPAVEAIPRE